MLTSVMRVLVTVAVLGITTALGLCEGTEGEPIRGLERFDPHQYYQVWHGDASLPDYPIAPLSEDRWRELVDRALQSGLPSLNQAEQRLVIQGSIKAYVMSVESTSRRLETSSGETSEIIERYRQRDGYYLELAEREDRSRSLETYWPDVALRSPLPVHTRVFETPTSVQVWKQREDGKTWACEETERRGTTDFTSLEYYWNIVGTPLRGEVAGEDKFDGRDSIQIEWDWGNAVTRRVWIDAQTFFPIGLQLPSDGRVLSRTVKLTAVNQVTEIAKPAVSCGARTGSVGVHFDISRFYPNARVIARSGDLTPFARPKFV